ncbi:flap endonuclease 1 [Populus alba]|uniref:flap endonuclease 1 n=1 Tax=Populus alba TaxID=43335 RepID=UPI00158A3BEF|nr:flap endonuclease 1 [Populus alba]
MGIKGLTKLLADNAPKAMKEQKFESYFGRKIAIDASMSIYQFLIVVGRSGTEMLTNEAGEVTSHLQGMFSRTIRLLEAGIKPLYVFDGKPPDLKKQELAKRYSKRADATEDLAAAVESGVKEDIEKFSKRTVKVTKQHNDDCKRLLKLMGVPVIEAPSEAEAQCATLCKSGKVYAVASEDMDSLTFGAPRFLRHLMDPSSRKIPVMEFEIPKILEGLNLSMDQFIDLCILSGCDYCDSIRGIGGQTALKLIRQHGSIESILENINKERYQIPEDWPYQEARQLFKEPAVLTDEEQLDVKWTSPDEEGLITFLVNENGFNSDRVMKAIEKIKAAKNKSAQGRLESFFKPVANTSQPVKRKGTKCVLRPPKSAIKLKMLSLQVCSCTSVPKTIGSLSMLTLNSFLKHSTTSPRGVCFSA